MRKHLMLSMVLFLVACCVLPTTTEAAGSSRLSAKKTPYVYVVGMPEFDGTLNFKFMSKEEIDEIEARFKIEAPLIRTAYDEAKKEWESREQEGRKKARFPLRKPHPRRLKQHGKYKPIHSDRAAAAIKELNDEEGNERRDAEEREKKEMGDMSESRLERYKAKKEQQKEALELFLAKLDALVTAAYEKQKAKN